MCYTGAFFNDTSNHRNLLSFLHDALPISAIANFSDIHLGKGIVFAKDTPNFIANRIGTLGVSLAKRSEEHTSELQSQFHLVCRLLPEKKKYIIGKIAAHEKETPVT